MSEFERKKTERLLIEHLAKYPKAGIFDVFKFIFQSALGCEHLVTDEKKALEFIEGEYPRVADGLNGDFDYLDGEYRRIHLSYLNKGLSAQTLARIFFLSAKKEEEGRANLLSKLEVFKELVFNGGLPFSSTELGSALEEWERAGYPPVHHTEEFRESYRPAYRVISEKYVQLLPVLTKIDVLLKNGSVTVAVEGPAASGKSTVAQVLKDIYNCRTVPMDHFFLQAGQRTEKRLSEVGGNIDYERFSSEVLPSIKSKGSINYRPFDCSSMSLRDEIFLAPASLTVVEGTYSTHPAFGRYYDLSVFLDISPTIQRERILKRNSPLFAERFFKDWIPLENEYFVATEAKKRADILIETK